MISLIERRESSPTAVVLERIAAGLGASLAALFDDPGAAPRPVSRREDRTRGATPGPATCGARHLAAELPVADPRRRRGPAGGAGVVCEAGARGAAIHQQIRVLQGSVEVTLGRATHRLSEDDCLAMRLDRPTAFRNCARKPARCVVVVATERPRAARRRASRA